MESQNCFEHDILVQTENWRIFISQIQIEVKVKIQRDNSFLFERYLLYAVLVTKYSEQIIKIFFNLNCVQFSTAYLLYFLVCKNVFAHYYNLKESIIERHLKVRSCSISFLHWNTGIQEVLSTESYRVLQYNLSKRLARDQYSDLVSLDQAKAEVNEEMSF